MMTWRCINSRMRDDKRSIISLLQNDRQTSQLTACFLLAENHDANGIWNQLVAYFDSLESLDISGRAFSATECLNNAISATVTHLWDESGLGREPIYLDTVLRISNEQGIARAHLRRDRESYGAYQSLLKTMPELVGDSSVQSRSNAIPCTDVLFRQTLDSLRGSCLKSAIPNLQKAPMVFKGITFADYMAFPPDVFLCRRDSIYREIHLLCNVIRRHSNIMPPPTWLVVQPNPGSQQSERVCGMLYDYYKHGTMAAAIECSLENGSRISLRRKAKWCFQMADAVCHVHHRSSAWHQDLKPPNILLDDCDKVVIIDWEQGIGGTNTFISAPETDGSWDLQLASTQECMGKLKPQLTYTPYRGPLRVNNVIGTPHWDVFPQWQELIPRAVEAAEVYSLGSTMFLLLEEIGRGCKPGSEDYCEAQRVWTSKSEDIPETWKEIVTLCTSCDPNERPTLDEVKTFWELEVGVLCQNSTF